MSGYDYTITIFIGHGKIENGKQFLGAWNAIPFEVEKLKNNSSRQLIIIDACSSRIGDENIATLETADLENRKLPETLASEVEESKHIYNKGIGKSLLNSTCILHAVSIGEIATIDNANRGLFSGAVTRLVTKWLHSSSYGEILTIDKLFEEIDIYFKKMYPKQKPRIEGSCNLPFAVNPFI